MQFKNNYRAGPLSVKHSRFCVEETKWLNTTARSLSSRAGSTIRVKTKPSIFIDAFALRLESLGSVQNLSHFRLAERHPALAHAVMAPLICWSFSNSMFRYFLVDHAVPAMWRSLAAARLSAD